MARPGPARRCWPKRWRPSARRRSSTSLPPRWSASGGANRRRWSGCSSTWPVCPAAACSPCRGLHHSFRFVPNLGAREVIPVLIPMAPHISFAAQSTTPRRQFSSTKLMPSCETNMPTPHHADDDDNEEDDTADAHGEHCAAGAAGPIVLPPAYTKIRACVLHEL